MTKEEYELKHILYSTAEVDSLYNKQNFSEKRYLIYSHQDFSKPLITSLKNLYLGKNKGHHILKWQQYGENTITYDSFYEIDENKIIVENNDSLAILPNNYTWVDNKLYIFSGSASKLDQLGLK